MISLRSFAQMSVLAILLSPVARSADLGDLVGTWTWTWSDAEGTKHTHLLEVEGTGDKVAARERFDELEPVKVTDLKLDGMMVTFTVKRGDRRASYSGTLKQKNQIEGVVNVSENEQTTEFGWSAQLKMPIPPSGLDRSH